VKILAINGSPRGEGNTQQMLKAILGAVDQNIEKKIIWLKAYNLNPCDACYLCKDNGECVIKDDAKIILNKMLDADVIIIGSPVYYGSVTPEVKMIMDRIGFMSRGRLESKIGIPVTVARRWGHIIAMMQMVSWFLNLGMVVLGPGDGWCAATAKDPGDLATDREGIKMAEKMGKRIQEFLTKTK